MGDREEVYKRSQKFADALQRYTVDDFINSDEPYLALTDEVEAGGSVSLSAAVLLQVASEKTDNKSILQHISEKVKTHWYILNNTDEEKSIVFQILFARDDIRTKNKVSVLPLLCGSGKSSALTWYILNTIQQTKNAQSRAKEIKEGLITDQFLEFVEKEGGDRQSYVEVAEDEYDGLLIVTDSKERLQQIWDPSPENRNIPDDIRQFAEENKRGCVSVITEENSDEEEKRQKYAPVLCITTQRYFGWTKDEILNHLKWEDENGIHRRSLIIFDEQPYLNEVRDVSVETINDIDTALRVCFDDEVDVEEKQWCCEQWSLFRDWFFALLKHFEYDFAGLNTLYYEPDKHSITEDDDKFFKVIEKYKKKIRAKENAAYNNLYTVDRFIKSWGIFNHRDISTGEYSNKFSVYIDNRDKVTDLGAKVVVLDGTGDISPLYFEQDYVDIRDGSNFLRPLSYLTVKLGDLGTSKEDFRRKEIDIAKAVLSYLKQQGYEKKDIVFFTYKNKESKFKTYIEVEVEENKVKRIPNVAHFGDIRGKNDFTKLNAFAQVGLNLMQPVHYLVHVLGRYKDIREDLVKRDSQSMYEQIKKIYKDERYISFRTAHILADIDQCMFRSSIRNAENEKNVAYYLFYKHSLYPELQKDIEERYHKKLRSQPIEYVSEKDILDTMGAGKTAWRLRRWLANWDGALIKQNKLLSDLEISRNSFNTALRRDAELDRMFKLYKRNANNLGKRGAWYTKTCSE